MADLRIEKVVVTGGSSFRDGARVEADLRALLPLGLRRVAQGGAGIDEQFGGGEAPARLRSADTLAWLAAAGLQLEGATYRVNRLADEVGTWTGEDGICKPAFLRRDIRMLKTEAPDLVLAYPDPGSRGTWHCVREALKRWHIIAVWAPDHRLGGPELQGLSPYVERLGPEERGVSYIDCPRFLLVPSGHQLDAAHQLAEVLDA